MGDWLFSPLNVQMSLSSMRQVPWLYSASFRQEVLSHVGSELDDRSEFSIPTDSEILLGDGDRILSDLLRYVFFLVNWSSLVDTQQKVDDVIRMGYEYKR
jgi:hypothetical protein